MGYNDEIKDNLFEFGKHKIPFRCLSCNIDSTVIMEFIPMPRPSTHLYVGGDGVEFKPNPNEIKCPKCSKTMTCQVYLPVMIGE